MTNIRKCQVGGLIQSRRNDIMNKTVDNAVKFCEVQRFRQKWLLIGLVAVSLGLLIPFGYGMIKQFISGIPWGNRPMSDTALAIVGSIMIVIGIGLPLLFYKMKLLTEVREDGVYINFAPLLRQTVLFEDIVSCEVRAYRPIRDRQRFHPLPGRGRGTGAFHAVLLGC